MRHFKFVNPNPFHYAEQIDRCALLSITVFRTTATRFHAYLICLTHVPYIFNYTTLDFICQALNCIYLMFFQWLRQVLFLLYASIDTRSTFRLQHQPQMNLDKIIE